MHKAFPSLALHCLGPPWVRVDGREAPPDVLWRKHLALLSYLALSPNGTRSRSHLLGLLWPESPDDKARRSLNEAVRRLRSALGTERLLTRGDALQLNAAELDVDVRQFETLRAEGQLKGRSARWSCSAESSSKGSTSTMRPPSRTGWTRNERRSGRRRRGCSSPGPKSSSP